MQNPPVSILIPNYKTLTLTKLCLRLIRLHTDLKQAQIIVIDNDSQDESLTYLRSISWITLIERKAIPGETPVASHARALDLALASVQTPYVLSIHTDTLVKNKQWLPFLIKQMEARPKIAGVGSWKLEKKPFWRQFLKKCERNIQLTYYKLKGINQHGIEGVGDNYYYLRSHCAMYKTDLLKNLKVGFASGDQVAGKEMHRVLLSAGYEMVFLPSDQLVNYLEHINHATTVLNPSLSTREKSVRKGLKRIEKSLLKMNAQAILNDESLDTQVP